MDTQGPSPFRGLISMFGFSGLEQASGILDWLASNWILVFGVVQFLIIIVAVILGMVSL